MGDIYLKEENQEKALYYYERALKFGRESDHLTKEEMKRIEEKVESL